MSGLDYLILTCPFCKTPHKKGTDCKPNCPECRSKINLEAMGNDLMVCLACRAFCYPKKLWNEGVQQLVYCIVTPEITDDMEKRLEQLFAMSGNPEGPKSEMIKGFRI